MKRAAVPSEGYGGSGSRAPVGAEVGARRPSWVVDEVGGVTGCGFPAEEVWMVLLKVKAASASLRVFGVSG